MQNSQVAQLLRDIINTFAQYGQPASVDRAKALFESVLEERVLCAREALESATRLYSAAATLAELEIASALVAQAEHDLDDARRMIQAHNTPIPYPKHKGD